MNQFRLIVDPPLSGPRNMAIDQALLDSAGQPNGGMTLRLYQWQPATVSLGYFQTVASRESHQHSRDIAMVRRTTGGGAIVHDRELTYSLTMPMTDRWASRHRDLYDAMHKIIIEQLAAMGVTANLWLPDAGLKPAAADRSFLCFQRRAPGDIVLDGFKIGGSAQRRGERSILQHGSILLCQSRYAPELPGIQDLAGIDIVSGAFVDDLISRFCKAWRSELVREEMTAIETGQADEIERIRFGNESWNNNR